MIREAIILAGGLGTRLRSAVPDLPKCMAPVLAKPFIGYLLDYLQHEGIEQFILCLGYKSEVVVQYLKTQYGHLSLTFQVEQEPLGTGGALQAACQLSGDATSLVVNGDTFFKVNVSNLFSFHSGRGASCTLSLKPMKKFDRYGAVGLNEDHSIHSFREKKYYDSGLINGGVYALNSQAFLSERMPEKFSFEKDYLESHLLPGKIFGNIEDAYFIDIGIPEDFERAQTELILNI